MQHGRCTVWQYDRFDLKCDGLVRLNSFSDCRKVVQVVLRPLQDANPFSLRITLAEITNIGK